MVVGIIAGIVEVSGGWILGVIAGMIGLAGRALYVGFVVKLVEDVRDGIRDQTVGDLFRPGTARLPGGHAIALAPGAA